MERTTMVTKCPICGGGMKLLYSSWFCPRDCDRPQAKAEAPNKAWTREYVGSSQPPLVRTGISPAASGPATFGPLTAVNILDSIQSWGKATYSAANKPWRIVFRGNSTTRGDVVVGALVGRLHLVKVNGVAINSGPCVQSQLPRLYDNDVLNIWVAS